MQLPRCFGVAFVTAAVALAQSSAPVANRGGAVNGRLTTDQAAVLESRVASNPDDEDARAQLLRYYKRERKGADYVRHLLWLSEYRPESQVLDTGLAVGLNAEGVWLNTAAEYQKGKAIWEQNVIEKGKSTAVLFHAGLFFEYSDPERAAHFFHEARELEPSSAKYLSAEASVYSLAFANDPFPDAAPGGYGKAAERLEHSLLSSTDAALISEVGAQLVGGSMADASEAQRARGYELLQRAIDMDPENPKWKQALERMKAEQEAMAWTAAASQPTPAVKVIVRGDALEADLIKRVEPQYPEAARQARIQGSVEFTMKVAPDGHVEDLRVVWGEPQLVDAAKDAMQKWRYRPEALIGKPDGLTSTVVIIFKLPQ